MTRPPKDFGYWKNALLREWPIKMGMTVLSGAVVFLWAHGKDTIKAEGKKMVIETVRPGMDSLKAQVDTLVKKQDSTDQKVGKIDDKMNALIDVLGETFPQFKKKALERAKENRDSKDVRDALTGEKP